MKIRLLLVLAMGLFGTGSLLQAQLAMPLTFDEAMEFAFTDFGPGLEEGRPAEKVTTLVADPENAENMVAAVIKPAGAQTWSGVTFWGVGDDGSAPSGPKKVPLTEDDTKISIRVWTPEANTTILLKVENSLSGSHFVETTATTSKAGEWEIVTFDFANPSGGMLDFNILLPTYNRLSIFFNFGTGGGAADTTYYFDDVILGAPLVNNVPFDFEDTTGTIIYNFGENGGFDGNVSTIIDNPDQSGINESAKVVQMLKGDGQTWAGTTFTTDGSVNFAGATALSIDVWSPRAGVPFLLKLEPSDPAIEVSVDTTVAQAWETLTFEFGEDAAGDFTGFTLFPDFGAVGDGSANFTFYIDNIVAAAETVGLPLTFEEDLQFFFTQFDAATGVIDNPDKSGINESDKVAQQERFAGSEFAGSSLNFPGGIDFSASSIIKMKVWTPAADTPVLLKLLPSENVEVTANTTVAGQWEELSFDFTGLTEGEWTGMNFVFNAGTVDDEVVYYFDDVEVDGSVLDPVDVPVTFDPGINYGLTDFGNMGQTVIGDDPVEGASNPVAMATRPDNAETWAGTTIGEPNGFANPFPFSETATQLSMRVYAPAAGIPVRLKVENASNSAVFAETEATTTVMNMWETLVFDFGQPAEGTPTVSVDNTYNKLSVFFNFGTAGADAGEQMFYYDDILWTGQTIDGIGGPAKPTLPITFDLPAEEVDYTLSDFGGANSILGPDPLDLTNVVAATQIGSGNEDWAGTTMSGPAGLGEAIPLSVTNSKMSVRVLSPVVGALVKLKVEDASDPTKSVETDALTTVADAWETLTFDFNNPSEGTAAFNPDLTFDKASIFFNFGPKGGLTEDQLYYWDNIMQVDSATRAVGEDAGSTTITLIGDSVGDAEVGDLVFDDAGTELGKIASISGQVITLEAPLAAAVAPNARLTFVEDTGTPVASGGKLINISTRGVVGTGDDVLIGSLIIGTDSQTVLIQAVGQELAGVSGTLADPILELRNPADNSLIAMNDNWEDTQKQEISDVWGGNPPLAEGSTSSAILITLDQGSYSGIVIGKDGGTGVALIEIYEID